MGSVVGSVKEHLTASSFYDTRTAMSTAAVKRLSGVGMISVALLANARGSCVLVLNPVSGLMRGPVRAVRTSL